MNQLHVERQTVVVYLFSYVYAEAMARNIVVWCSDNALDLLSESPWLKFQSGRWASWLEFFMNFLNFL
jgi:hypothetical protein